MRTDRLDIKLMCSVTTSRTVRDGVMNRLRLGGRLPTSQSPPPQRSPTRILDTASSSTGALNTTVLRPHVSGKWGTDPSCLDRHPSRHYRTS